MFKPVTRPNESIMDGCAAAVAAAVSCWFHTGMYCNCPVKYAIVNKLSSILYLYFANTCCVSVPFRVLFTQWDMNKTDAILHFIVRKCCMTFSNAFSCKITFAFYSNSTEGSTWFVSSGSGNNLVLNSVHHFGIGLDKGFVANIRQTITRANDNNSLRHRMTSFDHGALNHFGLLTPNGDRDLGQHWLRQWLVA